MDVIYRYLPLHYMSLIYSDLMFPSGSLLNSLFFHGFRSPCSSSPEFPQALGEERAVLCGHVAWLDEEYGLQRLLRDGLQTPGFAASIFGCCKGLPRIR